MFPIFLRSVGEQRATVEGVDHRRVLRAAVDRLVPNAAAHTPYGMTECLPVADIDLVSLESLGPDALHHLGVCVGMPVDSVELLIDPLDELGVPTGLPTSEPGLLGEVWVQAAHQRPPSERKQGTMAPRLKPRALEPCQLALRSQVGTRRRWVAPGGGVGSGKR